MKAILFLTVLSFWAPADATGGGFKPAFVTAPLPSCLAHRTKSSVRSSSIDADTNEPDLEKFNNVIYATDDTVHMLRSELKTRLLNAADDYAAMRAKTDELVLRAKEFEEQTSSEASTTEQRFVPRLLGKIVRKISRRKRKKRSEEKTLTQSQGILASDSFKQMKLDVGVTGNKVIELAEQLSLLNPNPNPTLGFKGYGGVSAEDNMLNGQWKLRFTTAADASFAASKERGVAITSQVIEAKEGTFTNVVDFEKGKLRGFRVVVNGKPLSNTDIQLEFKSVKLLRESRFPKLLGEISIRLPSRLIRWLSARNRPEDEHNAPYLSLKYLDEDLRIHTTDSDNWFVQSRIS